MMSKWIAAGLLVAATAAPAHASNWYFVDAAASRANITFIDKDSIRSEGGYIYADLFTLLATPLRGQTTAFRFITRYDCPAGKSQLTGGQAFDMARKPGSVEQIDDTWQSSNPGTQGARILSFVCSKGANARDDDAAGSDYPFDKGFALLKGFAERDVKSGT